MHRPKSLNVLLSAIPAVVFLPVATATTITFDESPSTNNNVPYSATVLGATFSATNAGTWGGNSNGDPGTWGLEGTNGPQFLGFNPISGFTEVVTFASSVNSVSLDFAGGFETESLTITLQAFNDETLLGSTSVSLGPVNTWSTLSLALPGMTSIAWNATCCTFAFVGYGVDNLRFDSAVVLEPVSAILLAGGMLSLAGLRRWVR